MEKNRSLKTLINLPPLDRSGGVSSLYRTLSTYFDDDVEMFFVAGAKGKGPLFRSLGLFFDALTYCFRLLTRRCDRVLLNPSLGSTAVLRDAIYAFIAKRVFGKKTFVMWHGWNLDYQSKLESRGLKWFRFFFFKVDGMFVLSSAFRDKLVEWGYKNPVRLTTTAVEDVYCEIEREYRSNPPFTLLYLARVERDKGIFLALETFERLKKEGSIPVKMLVAGDGSALDEAKDYVKRAGLDDVEFLGYVRGEAKAKAFQRADLYLFTSYGEGMPCSLLEALAAGLPVVTSAVGGILDIFEDGKMGRLVHKLEPDEFAKAVAETLQDSPNLEKIGRYNRELADEQFRASQRAKRLLETVRS